jgi:hypothetical protein
MARARPSSSPAPPRPAGGGLPSALHHKRIEGPIFGSAARLLAALQHHLRNSFPQLSQAAEAYVEHGQPQEALALTHRYGTYFYATEVRRRTGGVAKQQGPSLYRFVVSLSHETLCPGAYDANQGDRKRGEHSKSMA